MQTKQIWFGSNSYKFSGVEHCSNLNWHPTIKDLMDRVNSQGYEYNAALLVKYQGSDYLSPHKDDEPMMDPSHPISAIRLGAERELVFTNNKKKHIKTISIKAGDLYTMPPNIQREFYHSVPKSSRSSQTLTITFRKVLTILLINYMKLIPYLITLIL